MLHSNKSCKMGRAALWHPFCQPGLCGLRGTTLILIFIDGSMVLLMWALTEQGGSPAEEHNTTPVSNLSSTTSLVPVSTDTDDPPHHTSREHAPVTLSYYAPQHNDKHISWLSRWVDNPAPDDIWRRPAHPYATNLWWRYANSAAKARGHEYCFVCSCMPPSTVQPSLKPVVLSRDTTFCIRRLVEDTMGSVPFDPATYFNSLDIGQLCF